MGVVKNIGFDTFPKQGAHKDKFVDVVFNYDASKRIKGVIVRDDCEDPFMTILRLEDGRHVLATECQYTLVSK